MAMQAQERRRLRVITNSEMKTRRRCAREHHYSYNLGYRSAEDAEALYFGRQWHFGLEEIWGGFGLAAAVESATDGVQDPFVASSLRALLCGYDARWGTDHHDQVVAVEKEFRAPLVNPETGSPSRTFELGGKIDVLLRTRFVEHKTTSSDIGPGSIYWRALTLDSQVSTYYAGAKSLGHEVHGCLYDVVRKPSLRPSQVPLVDAEGVKIVHDATGQRVRTKDGKKWRETSDAASGYTLQTRPETPEEFEARLVEEIAGNPDKYFQRGEVVRLEDEEREAQLDAWQLTRAMRDDELAGRHPRNADACQRYGRVCQFFDVCCGTASLDGGKFQRVDNVHQELSAD